MFDELYKTDRIKPQIESADIKWCYEGDVLPHMTEVKIATLPEITEDNDGYGVEIYCTAAPAMFYTIKAVDSKTSVGDELKGFALSTGSGCLTEVITIAKMINNDLYKTFKYNDGGRSKYFEASDVGDCVVRAIAIALDQDYKQTYDAVNDFIMSLRRTKSVRTSSQRDGISKPVTKRLMKHLGFEWVATSGIGQKYSVHLARNELPEGRIVCSVSKHLVAVIDGVINDTYDCSRDGTRKVYGYWKLNKG